MFYRIIIIEFENGNRVEKVYLATEDQISGDAFTALIKRGYRLQYIRKTDYGEDVLFMR